ncbi:hypothetical protein EMPS_01983 [Entomortierella parvispora]|uniref:Uncharacterized protein n=1 Tax=Entomortierella parvispora TaxID=205924 RepID=A0A9P3H3W4_9FUNG|nr:hypothetical protein EMPS_01983 [Entomortierella parvispora]
MQERVPNDGYPQRGGDYSERLRKARRRKNDDPCSAHSFHPPVDPGRCRTSPSVATRELQTQTTTSSPPALQKRRVGVVDPSTLASPQPSPTLRVLPARHPQLIKPLSVSSVTPPKATKKRPHPKTHTPMTHPKSKESDPIVHAAAAAAIIPPPPDKAIYPRLRNNNNNNNNSNNNNSNSHGGVEMPPEEESWLREEEQEASKASPKVILIALGASIGGLSACFFCILGLGRALGCCYWRRLARDKKRSSLSSSSSFSPSLTDSTFSQAPTLAGGAGGGRLTAPTLPRDGKWVIGGPQPLRDEEKEGEKGCLFLAGVYGERGGPKSASPSIASTLVPKEGPVEGKGKYQQQQQEQQQQEPRFTEFWHDSPSPSSPVPSSISILKPWKRIQRSQGSHPRIEIPSSARTMHITSPMDPLPPRRPPVPSEQQQQDANEQNILSPVSTTSGNMIGRSRRMPAHLPTPRAFFKPQALPQGPISQGNHLDHPPSSDSSRRSSRGEYPREGDDDNDDNDDNDAGVEWLMMTSPPLAQALPSEPQQWDRERDQGHYDNDATVHDFNNGWGDQFVSKGEGYFASTHAYPYPHVNAASPSHHDQVFQ